ncbi:MAG: RluA family pseudouridine synthase [Sphingomonadales bacterium]
MIDREATIRQVQVSETAAGERVDKLLATALEDISRQRLKALIVSGQVTVTEDGPARPVDGPAYRVKAGQLLTICIPEAGQAAPQGQHIPLEVCFEDEHLIVIDKPAGLVVHPAPGNPDNTLVNALIAHCGASLSGIGGVKRPGIVHRLDKDTSGLLVVAKTDAAHAGLAEQFSSRVMERAYLAVVRGSPRPGVGTVEGNIGRSPRNRKKMTVLKQGGRTALTNYRVRARFGDAASLVECRLATGRTHQIRVHMTHIGHPIMGDPTYGRSRGPAVRALPEEVREAIKALNRQALHACSLGFTHPITAEFLKFESPLPHDMERLVALLQRLNN